LKLFLGTPRKSLGINMDNINKILVVLLFIFTALAFHSLGFAHGFERHRDLVGDDNYETIEVQKISVLSRDAISYEIWLRFEGPTRVSKDIIAINSEIVKMASSAFLIKERPAAVRYIQKYFNDENIKVEDHDP
jgi:hypothetical protein